jgi:hypothetical protein
MTTLREIFEAGFGAYVKKYKLPYRSYQAANAIINCRTAAMGGHIQRCENGHVVGVQYNSCRHRSCPQCNERGKTQWADAQAGRLLGCEHYHVIFTLPHELLDWWSYNRRVMTDLLFSSASGALMKLLTDERHLGATPGIVASLHTWGRTLSRHPHVHCLVTGGGLTSGGEWRSSRAGYLLPVKALKAVYRGKLLEGLEAALNRGELCLPPGLGSDGAHRLLRTIARKEWNIRVQERYAHGNGVMKYLGRYVRGGPISNRRVVEAGESQVRFRYRDHRDGKNKQMTLSRDEFIGRVLWHVPEPGRHVTRHYGLYGHKARTKREVCRTHLGQAPEPERPQAIDWQTYLERLGYTEQTRCSACGGRIQMGPALARKILRRRISIDRWARSDSVQQDVQVDRASATDPPKGWAQSSLPRFSCARAAAT